MFKSRVECDVLVIGGGLAAIRAALAATAAGACTAMMLKGVLGKSGSSAVAGGGLAAVLGISDVPEDHLHRHFVDTMVAGDFINDPDLVRQLVTQSPDAIRELEGYGAEFVKKESGEIEVFLAPAHTSRRSVRVAGGGTARLMGPLAEYVRHQPIALLENTMALDLLVEDGHAAGVVAVRDGALALVRCKALVLASGGAGRIYPLTSTQPESTGDGFALALRHGLALTGMEFVQFTPTALAFPKELEGASTGGVLLGLPGTRMWNSRQERFMERYDPERREASTRAILSRAIQTEVVEGRGSPHGGIFLDLTRNDAETLVRLAKPFMAKLAPFGIDITQQPIEIAPAVHYFMGGVEINALAETALPRLFAAGEVAGGLQGSNRLSSNSLSEVNTFGRIAGRQAAEAARVVRTAPGWSGLEAGARAALKGIAGEAGAKPQAEALAALHEELKRVMFGAAGIVRDAKAMKRGLGEIGKLRSRLAQMAPVAPADLRKYFEVRNMLDTAEAVTASALHRRESRGAHFRTDCPNRDDARWLVATRVYATDKGMKVVERELPENRALAADFSKG